MQSLKIRPTDKFFMLTDKQAEAMGYLSDDIHTEIFFGGGAGGGKSKLGCIWIIQSCLNYPGTRWALGRARLKNVKDTTLLTFFETCSNFGLVPGEDYKYNAMNSIIQFNNGSHGFVDGSSVYLKDLFLYPSDPEFDSLGSSEYTGAFIDEASEVTEKAKNILMSRIRFKLLEFNLIPKLLIASNPAKNFLYFQFYKPAKDGTIEPYRVFIPSLVGDNPYMPHHYRDNLFKMTDEIAKERLLYGNFEYDEDPAKIFDYPKILDMFTNTTPESEERYLITDVARHGRDSTFITYWEGLTNVKCWEYNMKMAPEEYKKAPTKFTEEKLKMIAKQLFIPYSNILTDDDGVGGGVVDHIDGSRGFINNSKAIQVVNCNYVNLKSQCYDYLAQYVNHGKIATKIGNERIKNELIEELQQIRRKDIDKDGKIAMEGKDKIKERMGRSPDKADNFMMRMWYELNPGRIAMLRDPDNITGLY